MLEDVDIIVRVFIKNVCTKCLYIGENNHNSRCPYKPYENSLIYSLSLLVKSFKEEVQRYRDHVHVVRG